MKSKEEQIKDFAVKMFLDLEEVGVYLKPEEQQRFVDKYVHSEEELSTIINEMLNDAREIKGSHDQRNKKEYTTPAPVIEHTEGKKLTYNRPRGNGFANTVMIAVVVGALLGVLFAIAFLSIK